MTVPTLQRALAELMGGRHGVSMYVAPSWAALDYGGLIVALFVPGTSTPCPALSPGSRVRVVAQGNTMGSSSFPPFGGGDSLRLAIRSFDDMESLRMSKHSRSPCADDDDTSTGDDGDEPATDRATDRSFSFPGSHQLPNQIPDDDGNVSNHEVDPSVRVTRRERTLLMTTFCREQRLARKTYLRHLRATFNAEVEEGRDHRNSFVVFFPTEAECLAEAWENYLFDHIMQYDEDQAHLLVSFRQSLRLITTVLCPFGVVYDAFILGNKNPSLRAIKRGGSHSSTHARSGRGCSPY